MGPGKFDPTFADCVRIYKVGVCHYLEDYIPDGLDVGSWCWLIAHKYLHLG